MLDLDVRVFLLEAPFEVEGPVARIGAREGSDLDTEARDGLHLLVEFDMFLHQLADLHVARNFDMALGMLCAERSRGEESSEEQR